jgi:hypothetical protein
MLPNIIIMALGQALTDDIVRAVLGATGDDAYDMFKLCTWSTVNKWSKYKPIRDAGFSGNWPAGTNGKYGLNLPTNWDYLKPRGGNWDGNPYDEPARLDDFRGYNHNAIAPFHVNSVPADPGLNFDVELTLNQNPDISLTDFGYNDYYFGIELEDELETHYFTAKSNGLPTKISEGGLSCNVDVYNGGTNTWRAFFSANPAMNENEAPSGDIVYLPTVDGYPATGFWEVTMPYVIITSGNQYLGNGASDENTFNVEVYPAAAATFIFGAAWVYVLNESYYDTEGIRFYEVTFHNDAGSNRQTTLTATANGNYEDQVTISQ